MLKLILIFAIITCSIPLCGQELDRYASNKNNVSLHFRFNRSLLEKEFLNNNRELDAFAQFYSSSTSKYSIDSISIHASSSPEGDLDYNITLAHKRLQAIRGYFRWRYPALKQSSANTYYTAFRWSSLIPDIRADKSLSCAEEIIDILQNEHNVPRATIEWRLKQLDKGEVWSQISRQHLRYLQRAEITIYTSLKVTKVDTIGVESSIKIEYDHALNAKKIDITYADSLKLLPKERDIKAICPKATNKQKDLFALKTNLLFDALTLVNVEFEVPINKRWSVAGDWIFPWWVGKNNDKALQILAGTAEGRYWFGNRTHKPNLTGWFAGVYAGGGLYDIQFQKKGYQGEFFIMGGLSGGYAHTINKRGNLRMEYSVGFGYIQTDYRYYESEDNNKYLVWKRDGRYTWMGPTKAKVSLAWMLGREGGKR